MRTEYLRGALVAGAAGARLLGLSGAALRDVIGCALADYKSPTSSRRRALSFSAWRWLTHNAAMMPITVCCSI